jgi:two-component system sensor histidine kinase DesK
MDTMDTMDAQVSSSNRFFRAVRVLRVLHQYRRLGWEPYAWLIYSVPFLIATFNPALSRLETVAMLASYPLFVLLYLSGYLIRGWRILWIVGALDALALTFGARNPPAASFFIYGAALLGPALPVRAAIWVLIGHVVLAAVASLLMQLPMWFVIPSTIISALIGAVTIQAAVNTARDSKLRLAQAEVEQLAKLAERERIARDLHDLLGHTLSVVVLKSELAQKLLSRDPDRARQEIAEIEKTARAGLAEVRQAITGYRSSGLHAEIQQVRNALTSAGIEATIDGPELNLPAAQETALSLALREAVTNVIRHAAATRCHIRFYARDTSLLMEVEDNGVGGNAPFGNGLIGMRERIQALGGMLQRECHRGTRLLIELPLSAATPHNSRS